jgi:hypothetical protein
MVTVIPLYNSTVCSTSTGVTVVMQSIYTVLLLCYILTPCVLHGGPGSSVGIVMAKGWTVRGSNPGGGAIFRTRLD